MIPAPLDEHRDHIRAFAVGVPARNEAASIAATIESLQCAADALPCGVRVAITIACDSCTDATVAISRVFSLIDDRVDVIEGRWWSAGRARRRAIARALRRFDTDESDDATIWIATTDADTVVPSDWLTIQLAAAHAGADAIAGVVTLRDDAAWDDEVAVAFTRDYELGFATHQHVHGANLGVRASAYRAVGGFPPLPVSEDHALWNALRRDGYSCTPAMNLRVATSARLEARAPLGFAHSLRSSLERHRSSTAPVVMGSLPA